MEKNGNICEKQPFISHQRHPRTSGDLSCERLWYFNPNLMVFLSVWSAEVTTNKLEWHVNDEKWIFSYHLSLVQIFASYNTWCIIFSRSSSVCIFIVPVILHHLGLFVQKRLWKKERERERRVAFVYTHSHHCHLGSVSRLSCLSWSFHSRFETRENVCPAAFSTQHSWAWQQVRVCVCSGPKSVLIVSDTFWIIH